MGDRRGCLEWTGPEVEMGTDLCGTTALRALASRGLAIRRRVSTAGQTDSIAGVQLCILRP